MQASRNHVQGWPEAPHGSRGLEVATLPALRGREVHGKAHVRFSGIGRKPAVAAGIGFGHAPSSIPSVPALHGAACRQPAGDGRRIVLDRCATIPGVLHRLTAGGRSLSSACALGRQPGPGALHGGQLPAMRCARLQILAACPVTRRGSASEPLRVDPCFPQPSGQSHLNRPPVFGRKRPSHKGRPENWKSVPVRSANK